MARITVEIDDKLGTTIHIDAPEPPLRYKVVTLEKPPETYPEPYKVTAKSITTNEKVSSRETKKLKRKFPFYVRRSGKEPNPWRVHEAGGNIARDWRGDILDKGGFDTEKRARVTCGTANGRHVMKLKRRKSNA